MRIGKDIIKFDAPNIAEAMRVVKILQNIDFDARYFNSSCDARGLRVTLRNNPSANDITFTSADEYTTILPTGDSPDGVEWNWQTEDSEGNTQGLELWVVVRVKILTGSIPRLAQFRRKLKFNNLGMLENMSAESISVVITPIELLTTD